MGEQPTHIGVAVLAARQARCRWCLWGLTVPQPPAPCTAHVGWFLCMGLSSRLVLLMLSRSCLVTHVLKFHPHKKTTFISECFWFNPFFQRLLGSGGEQRSGGAGGGGGPGCQGDQGKKMMHHCQICNRGFLNKSNIKVHLRTHTGEKPFGCEHCSKAFRQKAHLLKHMSIHKRISRD